MKRRPFRVSERLLAEERRVEMVLGGGRVICGRCGATLATFGEACSASLDERCPGFDAIETARKDPAHDR